MVKSARFASGEFRNADATAEMKDNRWLTPWLSGKEMRSPNCPLPLVKTQPTAPTDLRVTWLGHSTTLIEVDGVRLLSDPIFSERASPSTWVGPSRFHPPPIALADLPAIDAVIVSHEHYDHLDMRSIQALAAKGIEFYVPLGIGAHLRAWNVSERQIHEHDWWQESTLAHGVKLVSTPARHFNGRGFPGRLGALWTSWSVVGPRHRVFFSGDTGMTPAFSEIAARLGPFDVALLEIGQHHPSWGDIHLGPIGALDAHALLGAKHLIPIHWATFELALHAWSEPAETITNEADKRGVSLLTPMLGEAIEPGISHTGAWWRALPPMTAACP